MGDGNSIYFLFITLPNKLVSSEGYGYSKNSHQEAKHSTAEVYVNTLANNWNLDELNFYIQSLVDKIYI